MSESDSSTEAQFESKSEFIEAVREDGAELGGVEYYTEGEGSATTYHARNEEGEEEQVTKGEIEGLWDELRGEEEDEEEQEDEEEGPEEVHLGTFYFASAWDEDEDREQLEAMLNEAGWYIDGEVDSGGYRIKTDR